MQSQIADLKEALQAKNETQAFQKEIQKHFENLESSLNKNDKYEELFDNYKQTFDKIEELDKNKNDLLVKNDALESEKNLIKKNLTK